MKPIVLLLALVAMCLPVAPAHADYWECQAATCSARVINPDGSITSFTVQRSGVVVEGNSVLILDGEGWHHVPT